ELNPKNAAALNYLGYTYAEMGVQLEEAERLIRRALEIEPDDGFYVDSLGWVYYQRGDYGRAVEQPERAVELAGRDPTVAGPLGSSAWGGAATARRGWGARDFARERPPDRAGPRRCAAAD